MSRNNEVKKLHQQIHRLEIGGEEFINKKIEDWKDLGGDKPILDIQLLKSKILLLAIIDTDMSIDFKKFVNDFLQIYTETCFDLKLLEQKCEEKKIPLIYYESKWQHRIFFK